MRNRKLIAGVLIAAGIGALGYGLLDARQAIRSSSWPTTPGQIITSQVVEGSSGSGMRRGRTYSPRVTYSFAVQGSTHTGSRISFRDGVGLTQSHAYNLAQQYSPGTAVTVSYDAADPAACVLEPGLHAATLAIPGFGAAALAIGATLQLLRRFQSK